MKSFNSNIQQLVLCILALCVYGNTLFNDYALDDKAAIYQNTITQKGINGIKDIFTHYYYYGGLTSNTHTYRPITSLTHALEWQFFQQAPAISHFINILLYIISILVLYKLLRFLFEKRFPVSYIPLIASLLFSLHPIHTEVVANIKGRDEILSLLFVLIAILYFMKQLASPNIKTYFITGSIFFLGLLCKESGVLFLLFLPIMIYFFSQSTLLQSISKTIPFLIPTMLYALIVYKVVGTDSIKDQVVFNVPYLYANASQAFATKIFILNKYLLLLLFPHPLVCDYTYNQIPYLNINDIRFWLSAFVIAVLLTIAFIYLKSRNIFAFSILIFFAGISIVSNLFVQTGVIMAERSAYEASLGMCIALAYAIHLLLNIDVPRFKKQLSLSGILVVTIIVVLFSMKVISRNKDWKDDSHLFMHDVMYAPDCVKLLQLSAYFKYFNNSTLKTGELPDLKTRKYCISNLKKAIYLLPETFPEPYIYLSYIYLSFDSLDLAFSNINEARNRNMLTQQMVDLLDEISKKYEARGDTSFMKLDIVNAGMFFKKAIEANENNARAWWNYGGICHETGNEKGAIEAWEKVLLINPDYPNAKNFLQIIKIKQDTLSP